jgi:hypothetical protein
MLKTHTGQISFPDCSYTPYISDFLRFSVLSLTDWLYVLGAAGTYLLVFEALKIFKRIKAGKSEVSQSGNT